MTRYIVYAMKAGADVPDEAPLEPGLYRSWFIVVDAGTAEDAKGEMKRVLAEWPRAEGGTYRIGALVQDELREATEIETFTVRPPETDGPP